MPQLLLGFILLVGIVLLLRKFTGASPAALAGTIRRLAIGSAVIAGVGLVLAVLARSPLLFLQFAPFLAPFLYWLWRRRRAAQNLGAGWGSPGTQSSGDGGVSSVRTAWLDMTLDHASGAMGGVVRRGLSAGRSLDELGEETLLDLLAECTVDHDSARVLEAYLDRRFGPTWRERASSRPRPDTGVPPQGPTTDMTVDEAYAVLGLQPGASPDAIRAAHRKLMVLNHPDKGGSDWLAAKINRARQVLTGD